MISRFHEELRMSFSIILGGLAFTLLCAVVSFLIVLKGKKQS